MYINCLTLQLSTLRENGNGHPRPFLQSTEVRVDKLELPSLNFDGFAPTNSTRNLHGSDFRGQYLRTLALSVSPISPIKCPRIQGQTSLLHNLCRPEELRVTPKLPLQTTTTTTTTTPQMPTRASPTFLSDLDKLQDLKFPSTPGVQGPSLSSSLECAQVQPEKILSV
jgi:hypothetical protein